MKYLTILALFAFSISGYGFDQTHSQLTEILKTYVDDKGMVDYAGLLKNRTSLDDYLKTTAKVAESDFDSWSEADRIAFLVNVYNAETLQLIIDHHPVESIKKIGGLFSSPWKVKSVQLYGKETTLDHVEHGILREKYTEERIHFALVCAAISCPPLRREAYTGEKLDAQLEDQARIFLNDTEKNRLEDGVVYLSAIFNWFEGDFTTEGKSLSEYVDPWIEGETSGKKVKFTSYDWKLNQQ